MNIDSPWGPKWRGERHWTPAEALASLPLVRRISTDLMLAYHRWVEAVDAFEYATSGASFSAPSAEADRLMAEAQARAAEVESYRAELARLDIRVAQLSHGLLAFRSTRADAEVVPLYWAPGSGAPSYEWPGSVPENGTSTSWPSRAQTVVGKRSRA